MTKSSSTEEKILAAAEKEFQSKGYHGARMREIAGKAGINKGLLHYYFKTKDRLFDAIFKKAFSMMTRRMNAIFASDKDLLEKFELFLDHYLTFLSLNPAIPQFVINELNRRPDAFVQSIVSDDNRPDVSNIIYQIEEYLGLQDGGEQEAVHFLIDIMAMSVFPFIARPMLQGLMQKENDEMQKILKGRKAHILQMIQLKLKPLP